MLQNVLLFSHLKMFKIGCMLNVIYCNKPCVACCSVWHRTTKVHSCGSHLVRSVGFLQLTAWWAAQWCGLVVMCKVQHIVTNHTESQISRKEEQHCLLPPLVDDFTCVHSKNPLLTSRQLYFLVPLSSFLAHLLAHIPSSFQCCHFSSPFYNLQVKYHNVIKIFCHYSTVRLGNFIQ